MTPVKASPWSSTAQHCRRRPCLSATRGQKPANLARACAPQSTGNEPGFKHDPVADALGLTTIRHPCEESGGLPSAHCDDSCASRESYPRSTSWAHQGITHRPVRTSLRRSDERAFEDLAITPRSQPDRSRYQPSHIDQVADHPGIASHACGLDGRRLRLAKSASTHATRYRGWRGPESEREEVN
jgi:hypothetical protein